MSIRFLYYSIRFGVGTSFFVSGIVIGITYWFSLPDFFLYLSIVLFACGFLFPRLYYIWCEGRATDKRIKKSGRVVKIIELITPKMSTGYISIHTAYFIVIDFWNEELWFITKNYLHKDLEADRNYVFILDGNKCVGIDTCDVNKF